MAQYVPVMVLRHATSITRGIGRGGPWKSRLFWALKWLRAKRMPFGPDPHQRYAVPQHCLVHSLVKREEAEHICNVNENVPSPGAQVFYTVLGKMFHHAFR
jgi:hypothetical protein